MNEKELKFLRKKLLRLEKDISSIDVSISILAEARDKLDKKRGTLTEKLFMHTNSKTGGENKKWEK